MTAAHPDRRADLDGLRGVAVLLVIFLHYVMRSGVYQLGPIPAPVHMMLDSSWSGVDIFFVLSGFLIGGNLMDNRQAGNYFRVFYTRRAYRILPLALLAIAFAFLLMPAMGVSTPSDKGVPLFAYLLFINNFWTASGVPAYAPLGPMWSLAIEEQFYLAAPLFVWLVSPRARIAILGAIIVLSPFARLYWPWHSAWDFTLCRLDGLAAGMLVAALVRDQGFVEVMRRNQRHLPVLAFMAVSGSMLFSLQLATSMLQRVAFGVTLYSISAALIIACLHFDRSSQLAKILSRAYLAKLGQWSFFLYLMHLPILFCVYKTGIARPLVPVVSLVVCLIGAALSWRYLEKPLIDLGKKSKYGDR